MTWRQRYHEWRANAMDRLAEWKDEQARRLRERADRHRAAAWNIQPPAEAPVTQVVGSVKISGPPVERIHGTMFTPLDELLQAQAEHPSRGGFPGPGVWTEDPEFPEDPAMVELLAFGDLEYHPEPVQGSFVAYPVEETEDDLLPFPDPDGPDTPEADHLFWEETMPNLLRHIGDHTHPLRQDDIEQWPPFDPRHATDFPDDPLAS